MVHDGLDRGRGWCHGATLLVIVLWSSVAWGSMIRSAGTLNAQAARVMVVSTDPVFQEVLNSDFSVAHTAPGAKLLTLTVSVMARKLTPGLTIDEVAPGVPAAADLLRAAGYRPDAMEQPQANGSPLPPDVAAYMSNGGPLPQQRTQIDTQELLGYPGRPDTMTPLPRDAIVREFANSEPQGNFDTALVAHAVLSNGGDMTVVAVVLPGEDMETAKKEMAERIANAVLH
jgi:hypothetical protein